MAFVSRVQLCARITRYLDTYNRMVEPPEGAAGILKDVLVYISGDYLKERHERLKQRKEQGRTR